MSRVGKLPIFVPSGTTVEIKNLNITVKGPKGVLQKTFKGNINIFQEGENIKIVPLSDDKQTRSMWGTARSIIKNMIQGVTTGFTQELEVNGVGYRASVKGDILNLSLGKSHQTKIIVPEGIKVEAPKQTIVILESIDKEKLGQIASLIIKQRPPEPYKGKGIKRKGQYVQRKDGKKK